MKFVTENINGYSESSFLTKENVLICATSIRSDNDFMLKQSMCHSVEENQLYRQILFISLPDKLF